MNILSRKLGSFGGSSLIVLLSKLFAGKCGFFIGFILGFCSFGYVFLLQSCTCGSPHLQFEQSSSPNVNEVHKILDSFHRINAVGSETQFSLEQRHTVLADFLHAKVKVLCWILTSPDTLKERAYHVNKTWGKRCNKILFMSTQLDDEMDNVVALPVTEGRDFLWSKTKEALRYIYRYHMDEYDWFLKADDDTYVVMENLRYMLYAYPTDIPIYFGCKFKKYVKQGYMSGGAGYVLSKEAVRRFAEKGIHDEHKCTIEDDGAEDVELGQCMENLGIIAGDSRDSMKRGKFFPANVEYQIFPPDDPSDWIYAFDFYGVRGGFDCCSNNAISFHYIAPREMYVYDYLIYYLQPYGHLDIPQHLPAQLTYDDVLLIHRTTSTTDADETKNEGFLYETESLLDTSQSSDSTGGF